MAKLVMALLVSVAALHAENNPDVFRTFHLSWQPQSGATNYGVSYKVRDYDGGHQDWPVGNRLFTDMNFLIPGVPYSFLPYYDNSTGRHWFGVWTNYTAPGARELGINPTGRVRYIVQQNTRTRLLASPDLKNWTTVADHVWPGDGIAEFFGGTSIPTRFYRALDN